jgi:hypothetical protein
MTPLAKKISAVVAVIALAFLAYYGTFLPFQKSTRFIATVRSMGGVRSVEDFEQMFAAVLRIPSPIGQEELVRNMATEVTGFVSRGATQPAIEEELVRFVEEFFAPIVARGKGMSFGQDLYILGTLNRLVYWHTKKPHYLDAAERYYAKGVELGPNRPQPLQGLLDVAILKNDAERAKLVAERIYTLWPTDSRIEAVLQAIQVATSSLPSTNAGKKR